MKALIITITVFLVLTPNSTSFGQTRQSPARSTKSVSATKLALSVASHSVGKLAIAVNNFGSASGTVSYGGLNPEVVYLGDFSALTQGYPKGSNIQYLYSSALWLGGIVGRDTLVSVGDDISRHSVEFYPDVAPFGLITARSILGDETGEAVSEEDYIAVYTDTFTSGVDWLVPDYFHSRPHIPLHLEVTQRSYAWSYGYADDFVLFDYAIRNIGDETIHKAYVGIYVNADVYYRPPFIDDSLPIGLSDDLCGFLDVYPSWYDCGEDTLNIAWTADNDGDPVDGAWSESRIPYKSARGILGLRFLTLPGDNEQVSFNWWSSNYDPTKDFGPRARPTEINPYRDFRTGGTGTPEGDVNKYYLMRNGEFDYDQAYTAQVGPNDPYWLYPPSSVADLVSTGGDAQYLLSFGPFTVYPGDELTFAFAIVGGENFHNDPDNGTNLEEGFIDRYYRNVDFSNLAKNAQWASWVYDNPGVDSDGDGNRGKSRICVYDSVLIDGEWVVNMAETTYYCGDGVPDWRAASPPPAPEFWLERQVNGIRVRFNGEKSETTRDIFTNEIDFEGYRVYMGLDQRENSLSMMASYDKLDYDKYVYRRYVASGGDYVLEGSPLSLADLRCLYGRGADPCTDSLFAPESYTKLAPYLLDGYADSVFYFVRHDYNQSEFGHTTPIQKVYPDATLPAPGDPVGEADTTAEGYLKYYEYEFIVERLLPTVPYYFNVTAFDYGSPESGVYPLETSKLLGVKSAFPAGELSQITGERGEVYIYPNPYRLDAGYRADGFEGRQQPDLPDYRTRAVHFENLPPVCVIRIMTLDGDLVRTIHHDTDPLDPNHTHDSWNLINRNVQLVVSGIYYWTVEEPNGTVQMGKLVIIL